MQKIFAVDIDNVLAHAEEEVQRLFQEVTGEPWPIGTYGSAGGLDQSQLDRDRLEMIFSRFHEESIPRLPLLPGVKPALDLLHSRYRIVLITARRPHSRPQTLEWLTKHSLPFDALYHTEDKTKIPESLTVAIDDHPVHIQAYRDMGIQVFVMDQPWNQSVQDPQVTRVSGWDVLIQLLDGRPHGSWL
ncbi:MAG: hypothetical protein AB7P17_06535 [Nitrospirales bacterium]|nr:hypothetical protein [Nitrospirales bacterium]